MEDAYANSSSLLAAIALKAGGRGLQAFVCIDGTLVLAGSVLTAYVGVTGLARRLAADRCLPSVLLVTNAWRHTNHWIIVSFLVLTTSLFLLLTLAATASGSKGADAALNDLSGVYSLAFLSVMAAFAISALALKVKRPELPRRIIASPRTVVIALVTVLIGLAGTIGRAPNVLPWFALYFIGVAGVVFTMFERTRLLRGLRWAVRGCLDSASSREARAAARRTLRAAHEAAEHRIRAVGLTPDSFVVGFEAQPTTRVAVGGGAAPIVAGKARRSGVIGTATRAMQDCWRARGATAHRDSESGGDGVAALLLPEESDAAGGRQAVADDYDDDDDGDAQEQKRRSPHGTRSLCVGIRGCSRRHSSGASSTFAIATENPVDGDTGCRGALVRSITARIDAINAEPIVFFAKVWNLADTCGVLSMY